MHISAGNKVPYSAHNPSDCKIYCYMLCRNLSLVLRKLINIYGKNLCARYNKQRNLIIEYLLCMVVQSLNT
jgi:hypothetical protein